jgi:5-methylcytosine-specific restriction endonuclease McrA
MPYSDPEKRRAYQRDYIRRTAERHREQSKEAMRRWRANNPAARLARDRAYKLRHLDQVRAGHKRHRQKYPEQRWAISQRRRARELGAAGNFTTFEWRGLMVRFGHRCAYCGAQGPLQADHRIPLSRGGTHHIENILPACRSCNLRKGATSEADFRARLLNESKNTRKIDREAAG